MLFENTIIKKFLTYTTCCVILRRQYNLHELFVQNPKKKIIFDVLVTIVDKFFSKVILLKTNFYAENEIAISLINVK